MKITQEEVVDRQTVLHIELEDDDMAPYLAHGYRKVVQHVAIPGFRKGKAPRSVVERYLGRESLIQESLDHLLPEVTERAVEAVLVRTTRDHPARAVVLEFHNHVQPGRPEKRSTNGVLPRL